MKIIVPFKTVIDFSMLSEADWCVGEGLSLDTTFAKRVFNCFDESALEIARTLKEANPKGVEISALTIDHQGADLFLYHLYALGFDHAIRIIPEAGLDLTFNPLAVARLIVAYSQNQPTPNLILLGQHGGDGESGETGPLVAEMLHWPMIRQISDLKILDNNTVEIKSQCAGGWLQQTITPPAVLVVGNSTDYPFLKVPTLVQRRIASSKTITTYDFTRLQVMKDELSLSQRRLIGLYK